MTKIKNRHRIQTHTPSELMTETKTDNTRTARLPDPETLLDK